MGEGASLGCETKGEVVLVSRLRAALERLSASDTGNPALPLEASTAQNLRRMRDRLLPRLLSGPVKLDRGT